MLKLYKFHWDCGRMGDVECLFIEDDKKVQKYLGKKVYFGEILGKYSDIFGTLDEKDLTVVSDDQEKISWLQKVIGSSTISGHNPIHRIEERESEDEDEDF